MNRKKLVPFFRRPDGREAGSVAVEFGIIAMPVTVLVLGTYDYFAASYQTANLAGAARAVAELARNDPNCVGNVTSTKCMADITSLISTMATNNLGANNTLLNLKCC